MNGRTTVARLTGKAGATVVAKVGVRNAGPIEINKPGSDWRYLFEGDTPKTDDKSAIVLNAPVAPPAGNANGGGDDGTGDGSGRIRPKP